MKNNLSGSLPATLKPKMDLFELQADRNKKAAILEKRHQINKAIPFYEANIAEGFQGNHPYDRLILIYSKLKMIDDQIRVLNRAIEVFEKIDRSDTPFKLFKFKSKLKKITLEMGKTAVC